MINILRPANHEQDLLAQYPCVPVVAQTTTALLAIMPQIGPAGRRSCIRVFTAAAVTLDYLISTSGTDLLAPQGVMVLALARQCFEAASAVRRFADAGRGRQVVVLDQPAQNALAVFDAYDVVRQTLQTPGNIPIDIAFPTGFDPLTKILDVLFGTTTAYPQSVQ